MKAQALMQVHEWEPAIESVTLAIQSKPLWWEAHQTLGRALLGIGNVDGAKKAFSRAFHIKPDDAELRVSDLAWSLQLCRQQRGS